MRSIALSMFVLLEGCMLFPSLDHLSDGIDSDAASSDAGTDGFFCTGDAHTLCVDFDQHPLAADWTTVTSDPKTEVAIEAGTLLSEVDNTTTNVYAEVERRFYGTTTEFVLAFDVDVGTIPSGPDGLLFGVLGVESDGGDGCSLILHAKNGTSDVQVQTHDGKGDDLGDEFLTLDQPLTPGTWSRLEIHIFGASVVTGMSVLIDGKIVSSNPLFNGAPLTACSMADHVYVGLGIYYSQGTGIIAHFDNVTVDVK